MGSGEAPSLGPDLCLEAMEWRVGHPTSHSLSLHLKAQVGTLPLEGQVRGHLHRHRYKVETLTSIGLVVWGLGSEAAAGLSRWEPGGQTLSAHGLCSSYLPIPPAPTAPASAHRTRRAEGRQAELHHDSWGGRGGGLPKGGTPGCQAYFPGLQF